MYGLIFAESKHVDVNSKKPMRAKHCLSLRRIEHSTSFGLSLHFVGCLFVYDSLCLFCTVTLSHVTARQDVMTCHVVSSGIVSGEVTLSVIPHLVWCHLRSFLGAPSHEISSFLALQNCIHTDTFTLASTISSALRLSRKLMISHVGLSYLLVLT